MIGWTTDDAIAFCVEVEKIAPAYGLHVALTGGALYGEGVRKDCDIVLYRIRHWKEPNWEDFWDASRGIGLTMVADYGWCKKCLYQSKMVDVFDPDAPGDYEAWMQMNADQQIGPFPGPVPIDERM